MRFSHSKLSTYFKCPMTYHLTYDLGITPKIKPKALDFGSAIHWGLEHNTSNLDEFYKENQTLKSFKNDDDKILQEVMIESFLKNKDKIFDRILTEETGEKLEFLGEEHELELTVKIPSNVTEYNEFNGIIDLLLITNKGFIIVDYKTSSKKPDFNEYLSQLYKYIYLMSQEFNYPVYRIAIINLQKSPTKKKSVQTELQYQKQLEKEYLLVGDDDDLIRVNIFDRDIISDETLDKFKNDLITQCDYVLLTSKTCNEHNIFYTNWDAAKEYGGSPYLELLQNNYRAYTLYNVKDKYLVNNKIVDTRPMRQVDTDNIFKNVPLSYCRYDNFKEDYEAILKDNSFSNECVEDILEYVYQHKITDKTLIENYIKIYEIENKRT